MDHDLIMAVIQLAVLLISYVLGRYVMPKVPQDTVNNIANTAAMVLEYATSFCSYAQQFMKTNTGEERMEWVVTSVSAICVKNNVDISEEEIRAIAQRAYNLMKNETQEPIKIAAEPIKSGDGILLCNETKQA